MNVTLYKLLICFLLISLTACDKAADAISGGGSDTFTQKEEDNMTPPEPEPEPEPVVEEVAATEPEQADTSKEACLYGMYEFVTEDDNKVHFRAELRSGGVVKYYLTGGPSDSWRLVGDQVYWTQPFPDSSGKIKFTADFVWRIQSQRSDCTVTKFGGTALDRRTPMHARRI